ncbi:MAG: hypothetical protein AAF602_21270 [Myxococcota bacterium]
MRTLQRIPWEGVRGVDHWPAHDEVVLDVGGEHLRFGPVDEDTARDIVAEARRRLAAPSWAAPAGARANLSALGRRASRRHGR